MADRVRQRLLGQLRVVQSYHQRSSIAEAKRVALTPDIEDDLEVEATILVSVNSELGERDALAIALMDWFKKKFFKWYKPPPNSTPLAGRFTQSGERVERYQKSDGTIEEFIRYNDPLKLIKSDHRKGRCGEWANAFCFLATVLGFEARHISAMFEDHVWVEIWSDKMQRWVHYDPCENEFDKPLLYELGWGKKLSYVLATQPDLIVDVSGRYSINHSAIAANQSRQEIQLTDLKEMLKTINISLKTQLNLSEQRVETLKNRRKAEIAEIRKTGELTREQVGRTFSGRSSGDAQWRLQRGETTASKLEESSSASTRGPLTVQRCIEYSCATNKVSIDGKCTGKGLLECCTKTNNFFRKVENDWNMAYLARVEGSALGSMKIELRRDQLISKVTFERLGLKEYESGSCNAAIATEKEVLSIDCNSLPKAIELKSPVKKLSLYLTAFDKSPDATKPIQWQHGQFFRCSTDDESSSLKISIS